jgi:hypothetical protein
VRIDRLTVDVGGKIVASRVEVDCVTTELANTLVLHLLVAGERGTKTGKELQGLIRG